MGSPMVVPGPAIKKLRLGVSTSVDASKNSANLMIRFTIHLHGLKGLSHVEEESSTEPVNRNHLNLGKELIQPGLHQGGEMPGQLRIPKYAEGLSKSSTFHLVTNLHKV